MLDEQRFMMDGPEREKLIKDIQKYLRENLPVIPLANTKQVIGIRSNIKNCSNTGFQPFLWTKWILNKSLTERFREEHYDYKNKSCLRRWI